MEDWEEILQGGVVAPPAMAQGIDTTQAPPTPAGQYAQIAQPQTLPPELESAHRPAANPQEHKDRMGIWSKIAHRFQTDPNLQRAMMLMGASMAQPVQPGQTPVGHLANAAVVGTNAYQMGQQADFTRQVQMAEEGRKQEELGIRKEDLGIRKEDLALRRKKSPAEIRRLEAGAEGEELDTETKRRSINDVVASAQANRRKLELAVSEAEKDAALKAVTRDNDELKAYHERPEIAKRVKQEIELNEEKLRALRASTEGAQADAGLKSQELSDLTAMGPEGRQRLREQKTGRGTSSAVVAQYNMWAEAYDREKQVNPNNPDIAGKTRDQFAMERVSSAKTQDVATTLARLIPHLGEDDPLVIQLKEEVTRKRTPAPAAPGTPAPGGPSRPGRAAQGQPGSESNPMPWPGEAAAARLPKGTVIIGPDGKPWRKTK